MLFTFKDFLQYEKIGCYLPDILQKPATNCFENLIFALDYSEKGFTFAGRRKNILSDPHDIFYQNPVLRFCVRFVKLAG